MIELSKCPNCASEDKVTIAGKDFCMRCGTPSTDQQQTTSDVSMAQTNGNTAPNQPDQTVAGVSKFNSAPLSQQNTAPVVQQPTQANQAVVDQQTSSTPGVAPLPQAPAATIPQQPTEQLVQPAQVEVPNQQAPVAQSYPSEPGTTAALAAAQSAGTQPTESQAEPNDGTPEPQPASMPTATPQPVSQQEQPPASSTVDDVPPVPAPQQPVVSPAPEPMHISADQPLTQPVDKSTDNQSSGEVSVEPKIHTHQAIMSLDKNDSGVFSDEQLDELGKNISDQSEPLGPPTTNQNTISASSSSVANSTVHTDIRPPSSTNNHGNESQPAVGKVAENNIKTVDKSNKGKKVLKPAGIALSIVALFLVGAYIWQVNYPTLAFKIASAKAGMSAALPGYIPGGYKLAGEIQTNPGSVSYSLINGGQDKKILITQTKTDWDSQALAEGYVAPKAENYLALQAQGLTIYMLGDSQATWVNKGTWYKIESPNQSLSQDQAIKIATSL